MIRSLMCFTLASVVVVSICLGIAPVAEAQCSTCAAPTVTYYQPTVAYQPVVATQQVRTGWYPGRWFDRRRMRRWGATTAVNPPTVAYTPYTAAYAYTPVSYTAAYRPYVAAYAPLSTTSYYTAAQPVAIAPIASACSTCGCDPCGCSPCSCAQPACGGCDSCSTCSSCSSGVSQAVYGAPSTGCASCTSGAGSAVYSDSSSSAPPTPQPTLPSDVPIPDNSRYESQRQETDDSTNDPSPEADSSTYIEPPKLFRPRDRSASRPTVEVHNAVYRQPVANHSASHSSKPVVDEHGWSAVSSAK